MPSIENMQLIVINFGSAYMTFTLLSISQYSYNTWPII